MATEPLHPGKLLLERYLRPLGISPSQLARSIGVTERQISDLLEGAKPMTPEMAARLAVFFDVPSRWWLVHQADYDAVHLAPVDGFRESVTPYTRLSDVLVTPHGVTLLPPAETGSSETPRAVFSKELVARLRAQVALEEPDGPRTVTEKRFADGTVALVGD